MGLRVLTNSARSPLHNIPSRGNASHSAACNAVRISQDWNHTLRALLRECTYLPDPYARSYLSQHILSRFRAYTLKERGVGDAAKAAWEARLQTQHQTAQSALNQLRRANQGERQPLMKALLMTYGRVGKRRWELMRPLLPAEGQDGKGASNARTGDYQDDGKPLPSLTPQLHTLLLSHALANPPTLTRLNPHIKKLEPDVPELNSWLRPMPQSRVRNLTKRWYRNVLERVLPPLPKEEWEKLMSLAQGKVEEEIVMPRRSRKVEEVSGQGVTSALEAVITGGRVPANRPQRNVHSITPRFMRKMWAQVFKQCPMMEWDAEGNRWTVIWGEHALNGRIVS